MGVQIVVKSKNPDFYAHDPQMVYLKYAWSDIRWWELLDILGIYMPPHVYDQDNKSADEVKEMQNTIQDFVDDRSTRERLGAEEFYDDAVKLLEFFKYYVANEAWIEIY